MFAEVRQPILVDVVVSPDSFVPITAELSYSPGDPFAVRMRFPRGSTTNGEPVEWTFARDLLGAGIGTPSGLGDVRIWPLGATRIAVALEAPDGRALLEATTADLLRFLDRTYAAVPAGSERRLTDVDLELASLLYWE